MSATHTSMVRIRTHSSVRALAAALALCGPLGCSSYRHVGSGPTALERSAGAQSLRVTLRDGTVVVLVRPVVSGDTLAGTRPGAPTVPVHIATREVRGVERERFDAVRTVGLLAVAYGALLALQLLVGGLISATAAT